jgi:hypothetical protein
MSLMAQTGLIFSRFVFTISSTFYSRELVNELDGSDSLDFLTADSYNF